MYLKNKFQMCGKQERMIVEMESGDCLCFGFELAILG